MVKNHLARRDIRDKRVLKVMGNLPRHKFVPPIDQDEAYTDHPLDIGQNQTISQPYMVALMSQELALSGTERILEIGTGSGYQTAIIASLSQSVYTIERIDTLAKTAQKTLNALGFENIHFATQDGSLGWPDEAPFDRIIVTAGAPDIPESLLEQLAEDGRMVIPIGPIDHQSLNVVKKENGQLIKHTACECLFVKLIGQEAWAK